MAPTILNTPTETNSGTGELPDPVLTPIADHAEALARAEAGVQALRHRRFTI